MGPIIWRRIGDLTGVNCAEQTQPLAPGKRVPDGRKDVRYYSGRYYRAIDAVTRGERKVNQGGFFVNPDAAARSGSFP